MSRASDTAYQLIRERIFSGDFAPMTQLKEEELAQLCGVSRTPIRDALRRLEAEYLVRRTDTQRTFVQDWSGNEVAEIFTLRAMLESYGAARAAKYITPEEIDDLKRHNEAIDRAINGSIDLDQEAFVSENREFHRVLLHAARSERLIKMHGLIVEQAILYLTARNYDRVGLSRSHADHEELVLAFQTRDAEWAKSLMDSHIRRAFHVTSAEAENAPLPNELISI